MTNTERTFEVRKFDSKYLPDFVELNRQWIETYFVIEEMDLAQLRNPQENILQGGGEIFFILDSERVVGTVAMVPHGPATYELAKMAVSPAARGQGHGDLLMQTAIQWARENQAKKISLLSNTVLEPAISLYQKHGFVTIHLGKHPAYDRCNIEMELNL